MRLTDQQHNKIDRLIAEGLLSNKAIADEVGCSAPTVWKKHKARDDATTKEIQKQFGSGPPIYRGGGEW